MNRLVAGIRPRRGSDLPHLARVLVEVYKRDGTRSRAWMIQPPGYTLNARSAHGLQCSGDSRSGMSHGSFQPQGMTLPECGVKVGRLDRNR